ncbi:UNVERIFIED_CONTAM: hypothetical protein GTU68_038503 [Idotea baltica]|nr:hypothetical protein [Idotea baltica]
MKRKDFLKNGAIVGAIGALGVSCSEKEKSNTSTESSNEKFVWKMTTTWGKNFPVVGEGCNRLAERIRIMSSGRLDIRVYGAGELIPPMESFSAVSDGRVFQMSHGAAYYWAGIEPAFQFFTSVPFGMNAQQMNAWMDFGGGRELWTEMYEPFNVIPFMAGNTGVQMGGWFNKKIEKMSDFQGLKMRIPGLGGRVLAKAGGTAVLSPGTELYTNLERGVIDATEWIGPFHDYLMGFYQVAKYYYSPGWHEPGSVLEVIVNKEAFESLPNDLQEIVETACYRSNQEMLSEFEAKNNEYLKKIRNETNVEILAFPTEVLQELKQYAFDIYEELAAKDPLSRKAYDSFKAFKKDISEWSQLAEGKFYSDIQ